MNVAFDLIWLQNLKSDIWVDLITEMESSF